MYWDRVLVTNDSAHGYDLHEISDDHGKGDNCSYDTVGFAVDDWSGVGHGDCGTISHSVPKKRLRQPDIEGFGNDSDGGSATRQMGVSKQGGSLGSTHGGDWDFADQVRA
jgi:hypothetical protein